MQSQTQKLHSHTDTQSDETSVQGRTHIDGRPAVGGLRKLEGARRRCCCLAAAATPAACAPADLLSLRTDASGVFPCPDQATALQMHALSSQPALLVSREEPRLGWLRTCHMLYCCCNVHLFCRRPPLRRSLSSAAVRAAGPPLPLLPPPPRPPAAAAPALAVAALLAKRRLR